MTDNEINFVIEKYVRENLSPKQEERNFISERYQELSKMLEGESFQSGSYVRFTSTTPVNDLDVIWVLPPRYLQKIVKPEELDPTDILQDLANSLETEYQGIGHNVRIKPQSHSVGIFFGESDDEFSIDVVPAIPTGEQNEFNDDIYFVPEIARLSKAKRSKRYLSGEPIEWIKSDPKGYIEIARKLNEQNESFRKVAKLVRAWRKGCKKNYKEFPLKSFHLEMIVVELFENYPKADSYSAIKYIFDNLMDYLSTPQFVDRADPSKYIDDYVDDIQTEEENKINIFVRNTQMFMDTISKPNSEEDVHDLLDRLFAGEEFIEAHGIFLELNPDYVFKINGGVRKKSGFRSYWLKAMNGKVLRDRYIDFKIVKNTIPYEIKTKWKVKNHGREAKNDHALRGEITDAHTKNTPESTKYLGSHYVECYAIINDTCVAKDRVNVHIVERV